MQEFEIGALAPSSFEARRRADRTSIDASVRSSSTASATAVRLRSWWRSVATHSVFVWGGRPAGLGEALSIPGYREQAG